MFLPDHITYGHWRVQRTIESPERRKRYNTKEDLTIGELLRGHLLTHGPLSDCAMSKHMPQQLLAESSAKL